jgi:hypothetical protein
MLFLCLLNGEGVQKAVLFLFSLRFDLGIYWLEYYSVPGVPKMEIHEHDGLNPPEQVREYP